MIRVYHLGGNATDQQRADAMLGTADISGLFGADQRQATGLYEHVACVGTDRMELAYRLTNSIDAPWYAAEAEPATVRVRARFAGKGCRSTSVGDVLVTPSGVYAVARVGFERLSLEPDVLAALRLPPAGAVISPPPTPDRLLSPQEFAVRLRMVRPSVIGCKLAEDGTVRVRCSKLMWVGLPCKPYLSDLEQAARMLQSADREQQAEDAELVNPPLAAVPLMQLPQGFIPGDEHTRGF